MNLSIENDGDEVACLRRKIDKLEKLVACYEKCMDIAQKRYYQLHEIHRKAKDNAEVAKLVRECVDNWNDEI